MRKYIHCIECGDPLGTHTKRCHSCNVIHIKEYRKKRWEECRARSSVTKRKVTKIDNSLPEEKKAEIRKELRRIAWVKYDRSKNGWKERVYYTPEEKDERRKQKNRMYYEKRRDAGKVSLLRREYLKNTQVKIGSNLRSRIWRVIKRLNPEGNKYFKFYELTGCTIDYLVFHLESQFKDGMSWDNYGLFGWHIDHIKPCSYFDLNDPSEQKKCFNYTNLQPLWARENISKSNKILI